MQNTATLLSTAWLAVALALDPGAAAAQDSKNPASKAGIARAIPETKINRDAFSGNETRIATMNSVNADCSSGPIPDLRMITTPQNGEYRFEEVTIALDRKPDDRRAACNGKQVQAVGVFYKSKAEFSGRDNIVIDVDFKTGTVRRFIYQITVR